MAAMQACPHVHGGAWPSLQCATMTDLLAAAAPASLEPARLWALIPCAGTGSRAIAPDAPAPELPKQYHLVAGAPMVAHTLADRKSTRLNSSHSQISYAVFCLKKKKKQKHS